MSTIPKPLLVCCGWLHHATVEAPSTVLAPAPRSSAFKKRYCGVHGGALFCWLAEPTTTADPSEQAICLDDALDVFYERGSSGASFVLTVAAGGGLARSHFFRAATKPDAERWINILRAQCEALRRRREVSAASAAAAAVAGSRSVTTTSSAGTIDSAAVSGPLLLAGDGRRASLGEDSVAAASLGIAESAAAGSSNGLSKAGSWTSRLLPTLSFGRSNSSAGSAAAGAGAGTSATGSTFAGAGSGAGTGLGDAADSPSLLAVRKSSGGHAHGHQRDTGGYFPDSPASTGGSSRETTGTGSGIGSGSGIAPHGRAGRSAAVVPLHAGLHGHTSDASSPRASAGRGSAGGGSGISSSLSSSAAHAALSLTQISTGLRSVDSAHGREAMLRMGMGTSATAGAGTRPSGGSSPAASAGADIGAGRSYGHVQGTSGEPSPDDDPASIAGSGRGIDGVSFAVVSRRHARGSAPTGATTETGSSSASAGGTAPAAAAVSHSRSHSHSQSQGGWMGSGFYGEPITVGGSELFDTALGAGAGLGGARSPQLPHAYKRESGGIGVAAAAGSGHDAFSVAGDASMPIPPSDLVFTGGRHRSSGPGAGATGSSSGGLSGLTGLATGASPSAGASAVASSAGGTSRTSTRGSRDAWTEEAVSVRPAASSGGATGGGAGLSVAATSASNVAPVHDMAAVAGTTAAAPGLSLRSRASRGSLPSCAEEGPGQGDRDGSSIGSSPVISAGGIVVGRRQTTHGTAEPHHDEEGQVDTVAVVGSGEYAAGVGASTHGSASASAGLTPVDSLSGGGTSDHGAGFPARSPSARAGGAAGAGGVLSLAMRGPGNSSGGSLPGIPGERD